MALFPAELAKQGAQRGQSEADAALLSRSCRSSASSATTTSGPTSRRPALPANTRQLAGEREALASCGGGTQSWSGRDARDRSGARARPASRPTPAFRFASGRRLSNPTMPAAESILGPRGRRLVSSVLVSWRSIRRASVTGVIHWSPMSDSATLGLRRINAIVGSASSDSRDWPRVEAPGRACDTAPLLALGVHLTGSQRCSWRRPHNPRSVASCAPSASAVTDGHSRSVAISRYQSEPSGCLRVQAAMSRPRSSLPRCQRFSMCANGRHERQRGCSSGAL